MADRRVGSCEDRFEFNDRLWNQFLRIAQPYFLPFTAAWHANVFSLGLVVLKFIRLEKVRGMPI